MQNLSDQAKQFINSNQMMQEIKQIQIQSSLGLTNKQSSEILFQEFDQDQKYKEIQQNHILLKNKIDQIDTQIGRVLQSHEKDFFLAFKDCMYQVQRELQYLRKKIDEETLKIQKNEQIVNLEEERDYFRAEALRLFEDNNKLRNTLKQTMSQNKIFEEEKFVFEKLLIEQKKKSQYLQKQVDFLKPQEPINFVTEPLGSLQSDQNTEKQELESKKQYRSAKRLNTQQKSQKNENPDIFHSYTEMQSFFVECVNTVLKEIQIRKSHQKNHYQIFQSIQNTAKNQFLQQDKTRIIEYFMNNDQVIESLFQIVFNKQNQESHPSTFKRVITSQISTKPSELIHQRQKSFKSDYKSEYKQEVQKPNNLKLINYDLKQQIRPLTSILLARKMA